jgi:hypothetical protein
VFLFPVKSEKTERTSRNSAAESKNIGPQSPWAQSMPEEILTQIFEYVVTSHGTLPSVIRYYIIIHFNLYILTLVF